MKRREFCRTSLTVGVAATYPFMINAAFAQSNIAAVSLDGAAIEIEQAAVKGLAGRMEGTLLMQGDMQYDTVRMVWNGMWDKHPALIARCASVEDVQHSVTFAAERNLLVSVRGGGHSWPGKSVSDGGLMIDLADMHTVTADPAKRRAYAQGGALLNGLDLAALEHGLVTTAGVVSHTGVGGFTLGGGFGRLNRKYGLAIDNLVSVQMVTADGQIRTVNAEQHPDLFWAVRGGGGNFGVVTQFEFQLHPFDRNVLSGTIIWPIEQARDVLNFYAGWYAGLSDDLYVGPAMITLPEGGGSVVAMEVVYAGDPAAGEKELQPLREIGTPIEDGIKVQDYMIMQTQEDATFAHGVRSYAKNGMAKEMTPALVDAMIASFVADPRLMFFTHTSGGAVSRVPELATAFPHRNAELMIAVGGGWMDPAMDDEVIAIARKWFKQLEPFTGGYYSNIDFDGANSGSKNYGPSYKRLSEIKGKYDPGNLFRLNRNILPAS